MNGCDMNSMCMYTPTAGGGHARYTQELLTALAAGHGGQYCFELVSSQNLQTQFKSALYPVHPILPVLQHRSKFATPLSWILSRLAYYPRREWQFLKWLRTRPDIVGVHFQEWTPWLAAPVFRQIRRMGKKVFYTVHNIYPHKYPAHVPKGIVHGWIRRGCLQCDGLFVLSDLLAGQLSEFLGSPHPPIRVAPHGVWTIDGDDQMPPMQDRLAWKRLLFFGAIRRDKGLDLLLRAAESLRDYHITIAGEPVEPAYFQTEILPQVRRLQSVGMRIDLLDRFVSDEEVGTLFATHSAIVLPYTSGFASQSGVLFMALAYGVPVVASEVGGLRDIFSQFKVGATFKEPTPEQLVAAIGSLYIDGAGQHLVEQISAARRKFSWEAAAAATVAGYGAAIEQGAGEHGCNYQTTLAH